MKDNIDNHGDGRTLEQLESSIHALLCKLVTAPFKLTEPMMIGVLFRPDGSNGFTQTSRRVREKLSNTENNPKNSSVDAMAVIESGWVSPAGTTDDRYDFILTNQSPDLLRVQG